MKKIKIIAIITAVLCLIAALSSCAYTGRNVRSVSTLKGEYDSKAIYRVICTPTGNSSESSYSSNYGYVFARTGYEIDDVITTSGYFDVPETSYDNSYNNGYSSSGSFSSSSSYRGPYKVVVMEVVEEYRITITTTMDTCIINGYSADESIFYNQYELEETIEKYKVESSKDYVVVAYEPKKINED